MVFNARKTSGIEICCGHPSQQYRQEVHGTVGFFFSSSCAFSITFRSSSDSGSKLVNVFRLSFICSSLDMPDNTVATPGRDAAKRSAQDATEASGLIFFISASTSGDALAREPPLTGSITRKGMLYLRRTSYSRPDCTSGFSQSA